MKQPISIQAHPMPTCETVLLFEDFEGCDLGTWIGDCNSWQTYANGSNPSAFYITDEQYVSGIKALHVAGSGTCWEGATYKPVSSNHILATGMMRASGEGPNGCHHYQNGFSIHPVALWSFHMPSGEYQGGLLCSANGGGSFTAIEGFENVIGQWYDVAIELDYETGMAYFWLDNVLVYSTEFNTDVPVESIWMRSGEGRGWFDDVVACDAGEQAWPPPSSSLVSAHEHQFSDLKRSDLVNYLAFGILPLCGVFFLRKLVRRKK